jgi:hypothetical protein
LARVKKTKKELRLLKECREILRKYPKLKKRRLTKIKDLEKRLYYLKVWSITESQPLKKLKNSDRRCFRGKNCYHLDHRIPISYGYQNKISPERIGSMDNLRFILAEDNMRKKNNLTEDSHKVLRKFKRKR